LKFLRRLEAHLEEWVLVASLVFTVTLIFVQVICRYVLKSSLSWSEELARYVFVWQIWLGASMAVKYRKHVKVDFLKMMMPPTVQKAMDVVAAVIWTGMSAELTWMGTKLALILLQRGQLSPAMQIPIAYAYMSVPVGCGLMTFRLLQYLYGTIRGSKEASS